jgi:hypothetical protein
MDLRRLKTFAGLTLLVLLAVAAPARADFSVDAVTAAPADSRAGANSDFTVGFRLGGSEQIKDLDLDLPPGVVGNPNTTGSKCTEAAFTADACPADSTVGSTSIEATALLAPITASGTIYNLEPHAGEPARLGIVLQPAGPIGKIFLQSPVSARTTPGDIGLRSTLRDMPKDSAGVPVRVNAVNMTLRGAVSNGAFMRNPTGCDAATTRISATSYDGTTAGGSGGFTPTDCAAVLFAPRLEATGGGKGNTGRRAHPVLTTTVVQGPGEGSARSVQVKLPPQLAPDLTVVGLCEPDQAAAHTCPAQSKVGEAQAVTPLLPTPLSGPVHLTRNPTGLPRLTIDLEGLLAVQLTGDVLLDGGINTTVNGTPDVPLSRFVLRFQGGPGGLIQTSEDLCKARKLDVSGTFNAYSGATRTVSTPLALEGCGPALDAGVRSLGNGRPSVTLRVTRHSTSEKLRGVTFTLPAGLKFDPRALARGASATAGSRKLSLKSLKAKGRTLTIASLPGGSADTVRVVLRRGAVVASAKLRRSARRRPSLTFKAAVVDAKGERVPLTSAVNGS